MVLELRGLKSLRAFNVFHTLMLGIKMLPQYLGESYEEFYERVQLMDPKDQEKIIREAVFFVELSKEDVEAVACFHTDPNGVPYGPANLKSLDPKALVEIIVAVCSQIGRMKIDLVSDSEKKN